MNSLAFSIGNSIFPRKQNQPTKKIPPFLVNHEEKTESSPISLPKLQIDYENLIENQSIMFRRREAIGGLGLGFAGVLLQPESAEAAEGGAAPCEFTVAPSGLAFCDKVVGFGPEAVKGQLIKAHYVGKLQNGKVFDSSYNRGKPLTFRIGVGEVIKGWDEGILGGEGVPPMLAGGKRLLKLPPELGYGVRGAGCRGGSCIIPPDSVLLFDVEFVGKA